MRKKCTLLLVMFLTNISADEVKKNPQPPSLAVALAQSIKNLLDDEGFSQEIGRILGKYANQLGQEAEAVMHDASQIQELAKKIKRYAQIYQTSNNRYLLRDFIKEENKLHKQLYKSLEDATGKKYQKMVKQHDDAVEALQQNAKFSIIKEFAALHDELIALGLEVLMQLQKLFLSPEEYVHYIQDWIASVQQETAIAIKI